MSNPTPRPALNKAEDASIHPATSRPNHADAKPADPSGSTPAAERLHPETGSSCAQVRRLDLRPSASARSAGRSERRSRGARDTDTDTDTDTEEEARGSNPGHEGQPDPRRKATGRPDGREDDDARGGRAETAAKGSQGRGQGTWSRCRCRRERVAARLAHGHALILVRINPMPYPARARDASRHNAGTPALQPPARASRRYMRDRRSPPIPFRRRALRQCPTRHHRVADPPPPPP